MYKSLRKILLIISTVILSVVLAACGTKSKTESQQESQPKPLTSQEVIEKYSEAVKNVKSFKYVSNFSSNMNDKDPEKTKAVYPGGLSSESSKEGVLSVEPFSILTSRTLSLMGNSLVITNYINESNELYIKAGNDPWQKKTTTSSQSEKADIVKKLISYDKYLEALKNVAGDLKLEEQGDNYILSYSGNDEKFMDLLNEFDDDKSIKQVYSQTKLKNVDFKLIINKSTFIPIELSFNSESTKQYNDDFVIKVEAKRTFSEINTAKVTKPEGIK
jgi:lipoprotein